MKTVRLYIQTAINFQGNVWEFRDCKSMENMLIDFIWLNVQAKYLIQTISYHFKWDMALWKWPNAPSTCSEPGGKQWQNSIRGWCNSNSIMISYDYNRFRCVESYITGNCFRSTAVHKHFATWWRHQMETFAALLALCGGNSPVTGEFPSQRPVTRSFDVFFDLRLNKGRVNNREPGDLRRHRAHYGVTVMNSRIFSYTQATIVTSL